MADRLCSGRLTSTGKMPTQASMMPMITNSVDTVRGDEWFESRPAADERVHVVRDVDRERRHEQAAGDQGAVEDPARQVVERAELAEVNVHHSLSGVVTIAVSVPSTMNVISSDDMRCVVMRDDRQEDDVCRHPERDRHEHDGPER